jgi:hypothetical protein
LCLWGHSFTVVADGWCEHNCRAWRRDFLRHVCRQWSRSLWTPTAATGTHGVPVCV